MWRTERGVFSGRRIYGNKETRMEKWTFENANMSDAVMNRAKSYVENWSEMKRNHIGLLFWGPISTGKSYVSGCIVNALLKQEVRVCVRNCI